MTRRALKKKKKQLPKKKIKVFAIGDHPFMPSGVGHQCKIIYNALLESGDFEILALGGATKHENYAMQQSPEYGEEFRILPINGYGEPNLIRSILHQEKPDILWFMTDPRFYTWLWEMEDEIRAHIPMVYYHVWDNYPYPYYNKNYYDSTDAIMCISKLTHDIVKEVGTDKIYSEYVPHSVDSNIFRPLNDAEMDDVMHNGIQLPEELMNKPFKVFWNNRNARRKQSGSLVYWFGKFVEKVGKENALLIMHTDPRDPHGQDLVKVIKRWGLEKNVVLSTQKYEPQHLNVLYNLADCVISVSDAEGWGLSITESLSSATPVIVTLTGGMQDQVRDDEGEWYGIGIEPSSKAVIGSQEVPYIYEDRLNGDDVVDALMEMYNMSDEERKTLGQKGRDRALRDYNFEGFCQQWVDILTKVHEDHSSWPNKKYDTAWEIKEIE